MFGCKSHGYRLEHGIQDDMLQSTPPLLRKSSPRRSKTRQYAPGCPKGRLKLPQDTPRRPQDAPRTPPKGLPRRSQRHPRRRKTHTRCPKTRQRRPDEVKEASRPPPDLDFGPFWRRCFMIFLNFEGSWKRIWIDFWFDFKACSRRASVH